MKTTSFQKRNAYLVMGGTGLVFSIGYLAMSFQLPFGKLDQPGAGLFPVFVGAIAILASMTTIWEGLHMHEAKQADFPAGVNRKRLLTLIGSLFGYFLALPWLGQIVTSMLFCSLLMRMLSNLRWPRIVVNSLLASIALYVVFVLFLKVPMPKGLLSF